MSRTCQSNERREKQHEQRNSQIRNDERICVVIGKSWAHYLFAREYTEFQAMDALLSLDELIQEMDEPNLNGWKLFAQTADVKVYRRLDEESVTHLHRS
jgi:hypothetical protein